MKIDIKITDLPNKVDGKHMYRLKMTTYKQVIEGNFELSELREMIEIIDNKIHH